MPKCGLVDLNYCQMNEYLFIGINLLFFLLCITCGGFNMFLYVLHIFYVGTLYIISFLQGLCMKWIYLPFKYHIHVSKS